MVLPIFSVGFQQSPYRFFFSLVAISTRCPSLNFTLHPYFFTNKNSVFKTLLKWNWKTNKQTKRSDLSLFAIYFLIVSSKGAERKPVWSLIHLSLKILCYLSHEKGKLHFICLMKILGKESDNFILFSRNKQTPFSTCPTNGDYIPWTDGKM